MKRWTLVVAVAALVACGDVRRKPSEQADGPASGAPLSRSSSTSSALANEIPSGLPMPTRVDDGEAPADGVVVTVSKTKLIVGDDMILELPAREVAAASGIDARHKRSGPNDLYVVPLGNALDRIRKTLPDAQAEVIIVADETTPFRVLVEVLYTLGQAGFGRYHLLTRGGGKLPISSPSLGGPRPSIDPLAPSAPAPRHLLLALVIVADGVAIKTAEGNVGPGCKVGEPGIAAPKFGGAHDLKTLASCVSTVKATRPEYASEHAVTITASPGVPFRDVIDVMDAVRADFPDVQFGVAK